jgi:phospholipase/carboxylesterase
MTDPESDSEFDGVEIETGPNPRFAVIWLHGLGADGNDFVPIVPELGLSVATRFVFPHARIRPITINGGYRMRAWYDIYSFDRNALEDVVGIDASAHTLRALVGRERSRGIGPASIVLAGFSQGGAIVLHTALTGSETYAGILALSTYLPLAATTLGGGNTINTTTPIWMAHGTHDPVIDIGTGEKSRNAMSAAGASVDWHVYTMPHAVCADEIRDIAAWLTARQRAAPQ